MDSKLLRRALLLVTLFVAFIFILILWLNGIFVPKQDSSSGKNASTDTVADESGMIIGSDLDAWKSDETFFDANKIGDGKYENEAGIGVVLTASSVEKDLRIRILDDKGKLIVSSVIKLAKSMKMKVVAEGVEVKDQIDFLVKENCDMIQGYYYAKPMPAEEFAQLVARDA